MSKTKVKTQEVVVTPVQASSWLSKNTENRPLRERLVKYYLDQMRKGKWGVTPDCIAFDVNGKLINGQHRLTAVVRLNKDVPFVVGYGFDPDAFNVTDTGKMRSAGDILASHGYVKPEQMGAIIKFIIGFKEGKWGLGSDSNRNMGINNQDILSFAEKNKKALEDTEEVAFNTIAQFKGVQIRIIGGLYFIFRGIDREKALDFFNLYASGEGLAKDNPIFQLRKKLIDNMSRRMKFPDNDKIAWFILTWNHWRKGNKLQKLQWAGDSKTSFPKPI